MSSFASAGFAAFVLLLFVGIYLSLFGLPGTVLIFLDVLSYAFFTGFTQVGWKILLILLVLTMLAEAVDLWTGLIKAHQPPVTGKSLGGAIIGATAGMILLTPVFWGPGLWGGFFLGGLAGLLITEWFRQSHLRIPQQMSNRDLWAMIGQKMLKGFFALIMIFISLSNIYS